MPYNRQPYKNYFTANEAAPNLMEKGLFYIYHKIFLCKVDITLKCGYTASNVNMTQRRLLSEK